MKIHNLLLLLSVSSFLAACASTPQDNLFDAQVKTASVCESTQKFSSAIAFHKLTFRCDAFNTEATVPEMKDAGWRIESVDIGYPEKEKDVVTMPVKLTIRKIF